MKKIYVKGVKPIQEVTVKPEGTEDSIVVGFRVYGLKERKKVEAPYFEAVSKFLGLLEESKQLEAITTEGVSVETLQATDLDRASQVLKELTEAQATLDELTVKQAKDAIIYLKEAKVTDFNETGELIFDTTVADTRTASKTDYWETPEECLQVILEAYFDDSQAWLTALTTAYNEVKNLDFKDLQVKN